MKPTLKAYMTLAELAEAFQRIGLAKTRWSTVRVRYWLRSRDPRLVPPTKRGQRIEVDTGKICEYLPTLYDHLMLDAANLGRTPGSGRRPGVSETWRELAKPR